MVQLIKHTVLSFGKTVSDNALINDNENKKTSLTDCKNSHTVDQVLFFITSFPAHSHMTHITVQYGKKKCHTKAGLLHVRIWRKECAYDTVLVDVCLFID